MPAIPSSIRIAGIDFDVTIHHAVTPLDPTNGAAINIATGTIDIDGSVPEWRQRQLLLHELLHGASDLYGSQKPLSEKQVAAMEKGLWSIFKDNPGLAEAIFGDDE